MLGCRRAKKIEREQILTETYSKQKHVEALKIVNKKCFDILLSVRIRREREGESLKAVAIGTLQKYNQVYPNIVNKHHGLPSSKF